MEKLFSNIENHERDSVCERHGAYVEKGIKRPMSKSPIWFGCPICSDERKQAEKLEKIEQQKKQEARRLEEILHRSCLPRRFIGKTFETYHAQTPEQSRAFNVAFEYANEFETHAKNGTGLIFIGQPGTGKSHLAAAIIQKIMPRYQGLYATVSDCIRAVRETWRKDSEHSENQVLGRFIYADLLVLDEVGKQYGSDGEQNILFDVIDGRYRERMPTIIMGNVKGSELSGYLGERLADRLRETSTAISFDWQSYRPQAKKEGAA